MILVATRKKEKFVTSYSYELFDSRGTDVFTLKLSKILNQLDFYKLVQTHFEQVTYTKLIFLFCYLLAGCVFPFFHSNYLK